MCDKAVRDHYLSFQYVPNWFVTKQQVKLWHDNDDDDHESIDWCEDHQKRKTEKAQIKKVNAYCLASIEMVGLVDS